MVVFNMTFDRHLQAMLLRCRGNNISLANEILEKLSPEAKERLFRIFQEKEQEIILWKNKSKKFGI